MRDFPSCLIEYPTASQNLHIDLINYSLKTSYAEFGLGPLQIRTIKYRSEQSILLFAQGSLDI